MIFGNWELYSGTIIRKLEPWNWETVKIQSQDTDVKFPPFAELFNVDFSRERLSAGFFQYWGSVKHLLIFTSSHLHIFSSSHLLLIFSSSHLLIFTSSHLHTFSSSHLLIFTSSHPHIFSSSSHLHIFSSPHLLTSSHIFSHLLIFTSSHIFSHLLTSSHIFSHLLLLPSCPLALLPSPFFYFFFEGGSRGSANETARNATLSHDETQPFRTK